MPADGLFRIFVQVNCVFLVLYVGGSSSTIELTVLEGLADVLLHCFNYGSQTSFHGNVTWYRTEEEIQGTQLPATTAGGNLTSVAEWDGLELYLSDPTALTLIDYKPGGTSSIRIFHATFPRDNAFYYCVDQPSAQILNALHVTVVVKIGQVSILESNLVQGVQEVNATAGQEARISCSVDRANPSPTFVWTKQDYRFTDATFPRSDDPNIGIISFIPTREMNGHVISCLGMNNNGPGVVASSILNISYPPAVEIMMKNGTNVLICKAKGSPARYLFKKWEHRVDGILIDTSEGGVDGATSVLHLPPSRHDTSGYYICTVSNGIGKPQRASYYVLSTTQAVFEQRSRTLLASVGSRVDLSVSFYSHPIFTDLSWDKRRNKQSTPIYNHREKPSFPSLDIRGKYVHFPGNTSTVSITNVQLEDAGLYTVIVRNAEGSTSYSISLEIHKQESSVPNVVQSKLESRPQVESGDDYTSKSKNGAPREEVGLSTGVIAVISSASIILIVLLAMSFCYVKRQELSIYAQGLKQRCKNSNGDKSYSTSDGRSPPYDSSYDDCEQGSTEHTSNSSLSKAPSMISTGFTKPDMNSDELPTNKVIRTGYLPPGTLQSNV